MGRTMAALRSCRGGKLMDMAAGQTRSQQIIGSRYARTGGRLLLIVALTLTAVGAGAQKAPSRTIFGTVRNAAGAPVGDAVVRLKLKTGTVAETRSLNDGKFLFSAVAPGLYTVTAEKEGVGTATGALTAEGSGRASINLTMRPETRAAPAGAVAAMQFADDPNFTIAGVTDWTAAGGHGSDMVLRASEALNREAIHLEPEEIANTAKPVTAAWKRQEYALRGALAKDPTDFKANHDLGIFYLDAQRDREAVPPLLAAYRTRPTDFANEFDLARALQGAGQFAEARDHARKLLARGQNGDVERLAGELDEKLGDPLGAVREFRMAVQEDPSEQNYFEWGSELLLHRAIWQAKAVFTAGLKAHPDSERMMTALGAALFAGALYDQAALRLCAASDMDQRDAQPYLFMGRIVTAVSDPLPCVTPRLKRFAEMQPANSLATYYYAMALWKHDGKPVDATHAAPVEALLRRAVTTDPKCAVAWLQLGALRFLRNDYNGSVDFFQRAVAADPDMSEAHYRLAMAYDRVGERNQAKAELALHQKLDEEQKQEVDQQRRTIKQFRVLDAAQPPSSGQP
ncbi:MAG TPA: carboxypeptidase regulatory-like domain-containing protein [Acidobacteriaceae bacterium]